MTALTPSQILVRPGRPGDAALAAQIFYLSMGRLADHLFGWSEQSIKETIAKLFKRNAGRFGHGLSVVAEVGGEALGMLVSCSGAQINRLNLQTFLHFFPVMGFKQAFKFILRGAALPGGVEAKRDEYYISNIGILPAAQRQGLGSYLLEYAEKLARAGGLFKCSLIVGLYNASAIRLYERTGYQVVETVHDKNEALCYHRMVKPLDEQAAVS